MKLQRVSSDKFKKRIDYYKEKSLNELLLITPHWAYGENSEYLLDISLHSNEKEYLTFLVAPSELIKASDLFEMNLQELFTGEPLNDGRIATILDRWDNKLFVDPPTIDISPTNRRKLCLADGRHRSKIAYMLNYKQMPVAVHVSSKQKVMKLIKLIPT